MLCTRAAAQTATTDRTSAADTLLQNIRGTVMDNQTLDAMESAQVRLYNAEGKMLRGVITQKNGQFVLPNVPTGQYTLAVTFVGYKEQRFLLTLPRRSGNFRVADILMREDAKMMAEAVVEGKMPEMTVVEDTVMYNADAFKLTDGALVEELVKKLPGITQDESGNFLFNGKNIQQILVDGKEFFGNNQRMVLDNLPAEIVDKIKAYEKKSDRARITGIDDGEERTVLDLQIKKNRKQGWFGRVNGGYGTQDRYNGRIMVNRFVGDQKFSVIGNVGNTNGNGMTDSQSGGATMNYQKPKIEMNGSVFGNFSQGGNENWSNSQNFENTNAAYSNNWSTNAHNNKGGSFNYKVEWRPDSTWNILFRPEVSLNRNRSHSANESATFLSDPYERTDDPLADYAQLRDIGVNHRLGRNNNESGSESVRASLQMNKRLRKPGRNLTLNLGAEYSHNQSESQSYNQVDYYQIAAYDGGDSIYHKIQYNDAPQHNRNLNAQLGYSEPLMQDLYLQLNYEYRHRYSSNERTVSSVFDRTNGLPVYELYGIDADNYRDWEHIAMPDTAQCNRTENIYQNHNIRVQLRLNRTRYQLTVGGNVQPQINRVDYTKGWKHYDVTQRVVNASPSLNFRYKFSRQETLNFRWNGRTGQPSVTNLIPDTLSNADPLNIRLGNPNLKPSFTQDVSFDYNRSVPERQRSNALHLQAHVTQNATTNRTEYNDLTGGRISKPVNINGNWDARASHNFNTAMDEAMYWRINLNTNLSHRNSVGYVYQRNSGTTVKNTTRGTNASENVRLSYRRDWESEWSMEASAGASINYNHSRSTNTSASNLDTYRYSYGGNFTVTTPWGMTLESNINQHCRRGYTDQAMNTNQLIWNATLSQRLLRKRALTISLRAVDILNQRDDVNRNISATSRTDSRTKLVNSYCMLTVTYRFGKFGGRGGGGNRPPRGEGHGGRGRM